MHSLQSYHLEFSLSEHLESHALNTAFIDLTYYPKFTLYDAFTFVAAIPQTSKVHYIFLLWRNLRDIGSILLLELIVF